MTKWRVYFNSRKDAPYVWSYDDGDDAHERICKQVSVYGCACITRFDFTKHSPMEATAWIEVEGHLINYGGDVIIYGRGYEHVPEWLEKEVQQKGNSNPS